MQMARRSLGTKSILLDWFWNEHSSGIAPWFAFKRQKKTENKKDKREQGITKTSHDDITGETSLASPSSCFKGGLQIFVTFTFVTLEETEEHTRTLLWHPKIALDSLLFQFCLIKQKSKSIKLFFCIKNDSFVYDWLNISSPNEGWFFHDNLRCGFGDI